MGITASFHIKDGAEHQRLHAEALMKGMNACGVQTFFGVHNQPNDADLNVFWSWKQPRLIARQITGEANILIMERGYIPNRMEWCSLAVNGFNGQGKFTPASDGGARFEKHFSHLVKPWKWQKQGYVLLIGQVPGDPSLHGTDIDKWCDWAARQINSKGYHVLYRPHPWVRSKFSQGLQGLPVPSLATLSQGTLEQDLEGAVFCVCYNSNTSVESILAGVPTVVFHDGSVSWPVCSHSFDEPLFRGDRTKWLNNLAWRQFSLEELENGIAWKHVRYSLPTRFWS